MTRRRNVSLDFLNFTVPRTPVPPIQVKLNGRERLYAPDSKNPNRVKYFERGDEVHGDNRWPGVVEEIDLEGRRVKVRFAAHTNSLALQPQKPLPAQSLWVPAAMVDLALPNLFSARVQ